ncbi:AraC family transcriptional regulator [Sneathiella marina]|uniref:AraC family transcriptional regulator n=1 Tax=Sneathiella marina TaxID=2950108 RepID=A0ABY4WCS8_9PROT|nr:AraC family transcriptional regulator [Sneathiella marina]USG62441.1 AraC family transcriptional regulator [Sneathiella marina]
MKKPKKLEAEKFLESLPFDPDLSSVGLFWDGIFLEQYFALESNEVLMPPMKDHRLTLNLPFEKKGTTGVKANWAWGDEKHSGLCHQGEVTVAGRDKPAYWQWTGRSNSIHVSLSHKFLTTAADCAGVSSVGLEVIDQMSTRSDELYRLMVMLSLEAKNKGFFGRMFADVITQAMAGTILRNHTNRQAIINARSKTLSPAILSRVLEYFHANYCHNIGLTNLAAIAEVSQFHFARMFKCSTGYAPYQFLTQLRIRRAQDYLLTISNATLSETALVVGFSDQSHFNRHFKAIVGVTPLKWLREVMQ